MATVDDFFHSIAVTAIEAQKNPDAIAKVEAVSNILEDAQTLQKMIEEKLTDSDIERLEQNS